MLHAKQWLEDTECGYVRRSALLPVSKSPCLAGDPLRLGFTVRVRALIRRSALIALLGFVTKSRYPRLLL